MLDLPGHHRLLDPFVLEIGDHLAQLADARPLDAISNVINAYICFFLDRDDGQRNTLLSCALEYKKGELAIAGDESELHTKFGFIIARCKRFVNAMQRLVSPSVEVNSTQVRIPV